LRGRIPEKAYYGCYGWAIAKSVVPTDPMGALDLYLRALLHGCYRPPLAIVIFLQIFLPDAAYRWLADSGIAWLGRFWESDGRVQRADLDIGSILDAASAGVADHADA
jgi:hypothetical protein